MAKTKLIGIDVMLEHGTRFYKTLYYRAPMHFDFEDGKWRVDIDSDKMNKFAMSKLPSLETRPFILVFNA